MMRAISFPRSSRWASLLFVAAGLSMIVLWSIYTTIHGPTSYDRTGFVLGRSTLFLGACWVVCPTFSLYWDYF